MELVLVSSFIVTAVWMMWTTYMGQNFSEAAKGRGNADRYDLSSSQHLKKHQFGHSRQGGRKFHHEN